MEGTHTNAAGEIGQVGTQKAFRGAHLVGRADAAVVRIRSDSAAGTIRAVLAAPAGEADDVSLGREGVVCPAGIFVEIVSGTTPDVVVYWS